jgi:hypothetical protein
MHTHTHTPLQLDDKLQKSDYLTHLIFQNPHSTKGNALYSNAKYFCSSIKQKRTLWIAKIFPPSLEIRTSTGYPSSV